MIKVESIIEVTGVCGLLVLRELTHTVTKVAHYLLSID